MLEVLEGLVELDALRLLDARVDGHRGEVALLQQLVELDGALHALDEDDHLVELERVEQLVELAVLLVLGELDVVLLQAVQRQLRVVDVDLHRVLRWQRRGGVAVGRDQHSHGDAKRQRRCQTGAGDSFGVAKTAPPSRNHPRPANQLVSGALHRGQPHGRFGRRQRRPTQPERFRSHTFADAGRGSGAEPGEGRSAAARAGVRAQQQRARLRWRPTAASKRRSSGFRREGGMSLDLWHAEGGRRNPASTTAGGAPYVRAAAACMNFLQTVRISLERVAENIITCFSCGVLLKISCTSARMTSF